MSLSKTDLDSFWVNLELKLSLSFLRGFRPWEFCPRQCLSYSAPRAPQAPHWGLHQKINPGIWKILKWYRITSTRCGFATSWRILEGIQQKKYFVFVDEEEFNFHFKIFVQSRFVIGTTYFFSPDFLANFMHLTLFHLFLEVK